MQIRQIAPVPIVEIIVPPGVPGALEPLAAPVGRALAQALSCEPAAVWVYVVRAAVHAGPAEGPCPCVTVRAMPRPEEAVRAGMEAVVRAVSEGLQVPFDDVWLHWIDLPRGRVFSGGGVR